MRLLITMLLAALIALALAGCSEDEPSVTPLPFSTPRVPQTPTPVPRATPPVPAVTPRSVVPGLDKGGLFGDGVKDLAKVDTTGWLTYKNDKWGYSFRYPSNWEQEEDDNSGFVGPGGAVAYPRQRVLVRNPQAERGKNERGVNCDGPACIGPTPRLLAFGVAIERHACAALGQLVADDSIDIKAGRAQRCLVLSNFGGGPVLQLSLPRSEGDLIQITLEKGRATSPSDQAVLETILDTLTLSP